jgi:hypothetical protein
MRANTAVKVGGAVGGGLSFLGALYLWATAGRQETVEVPKALDDSGYNLKTGWERAEGLTNPEDAFKGESDITDTMAGGDGSEPDDNQGATALTPNTQKNTTENNPSLSYQQKLELVSEKIINHEGRYTLNEFYEMIDEFKKIYRPIGSRYNNQDFYVSGCGKVAKELFFIYSEIIAELTVKGPDANTNIRGEDFINRFIIESELACIQESQYKATVLDFLVENYTSASLMRLMGDKNGSSDILQLRSEIDLLFETYKQDMKKEIESYMKDDASFDLSIDECPPEHHVFNPLKALSNYYRRQRDKRKCQ